MNDNDGSAGAQAEAAQWYARLQTLPVSHKTLEEFFAWRRLPGRADAFLEVEQLQDKLVPLGERPAMRAAMEAAWQRGFDRRRKTRNRLAGAGALVMLLVAGGAILMPRASHDQIVSTGIGEQREVALEDGSIVKLDTDSSLSTHFTLEARHVRLARGQAYFTVAHNAELPFIVEAGTASVTATGTQFDVRRRGDQAEVTLVQGGVDVRSGTSVTHLLSGQKVRVVPGQKLVPEAADAGLSNAWTQGRLVFDGVSLAQAIEEVNRYTRHPVHLDDKALANARFGGSLNTGDVPSFVAAVTAILPLHAVTDRSGSVHLVGQVS